MFETSGDRYLPPPHDALDTEEALSILARVSEHSPVVILGAGLTGLSAACHLNRSFRLIERAKRVGGLCVTVEESGYRFDRTGHLLHLRDDSMRDWVLATIREYGEPDDEMLQISRRSRIWSKGCYTRYPFQANTFGLPAAVASECILGFIEARDALRDATLGGTKSAPQPQNFEDFIYTYMGRGFAHHFMIPYNTKLWGVAPREMSTAWTDRFVPKPTIEQVISGAVGARDEELGYNTEFLYPRRGIGQLVEALDRKVSQKTQPELACTPLAIDFRIRQIHLSNNSTLSYDTLISTIPLNELLGLLVDPPENIREKTGQLRWTKLYYLDVALTHPPLVDYHWIYVPEEQYPFYRVGAYSSFSAALVPVGCGSLYVELAAREMPDLKRLFPEIITGLTEMGIIRGAEAIAFVKPRYLEHAYVIYDGAYQQALDIIHPFLRENDIYSCGRFGSWEYSAMEDALMSGRDAARFAQEIR